MVKGKKNFNRYINQMQYMDIFGILFVKLKAIPKRYFETIKRKWAQVEY